MTYETITYGNHVLDANRFPAETINALLRRGVAHFLGNEQASRVTSWAAKQLKDTGTEPTDDEKAAQKAAFMAEAIEDLTTGEIGAGRGPRLDPVEKAFRSKVLAHIANTLAGNGIKFPKGRKLPNEGEIVTFANGQTRTLDQMVENTTKNHGERLRKEAQKAVDDEARKAAKAKADAEAIAKQGPASAEALGL